MTSIIEQELPPIKSIPNGT